MAEVVAYIKANRDLIEQVTSGKVSVSDIVNNLTTNVANKPLSAAQGVALKALIDAITEKAIPGKTVNISYDEMRMEYGEDIFGSGQPKKALAIVTADLQEFGITIQTGKTVKLDGKTRNGFAIFQSKDEPEEVEIL
jgi:hypothetical protein